MWEGKKKVVKGTIQVAIRDFLEGIDDHIPFCPLLYTNRHKVYNLSEKSNEDRVESVSQTSPSTESSKLIREAKLTKDYLKPIKFDKPLNKDVDAKISSALKAPKKPQETESSIFSNTQRCLQEVLQNKL